jgi:hypothetical protein
MGDNDGINLPQPEDQQQMVSMIKFLGTKQQNM